MDPGTHGLASYTLSRAILPRGSKMAVVAVVLSGTLADLDGLSRFAGPAAYLNLHRTAAHSLLATLLLAALLAGSCSFLFLRKPDRHFPMSKLFAAAWLAALLHLALDLCQSEGVALFWPFRDARYALDWLASIDLWILAILLAGILLPVLFGLVTEEIGARSKVRAAVLARAWRSEPSPFTCWPA